VRELEHALGRKRGPDKNAPRTIDLDVIAWPGQQHDRLPHADIERYDFVAHPLAELDGHVVTRDGRHVLDIARSMIPHGMTPLEALTRQLRALVQHAKRSLHA
jgi:7,8-dihydro-6-hydroxymethylpterin-pyrophosphokinase